MIIETPPGGRRGSTAVLVEFRPADPVILAEPDTVCEPDPDWLPLILLLPLLLLLLLSLFPDCLVAEADAETEADPDCCSLGDAVAGRSQLGR